MPELAYTWKRFDHLVRVSDPEPGPGLAPDDSVVEDELVLVLAVDAGAARQVVVHVLEQVQLLDDQVLLEDRADRAGRDGGDAGHARFADQLVRDALRMVVGATVRDVNGHVLQGGEKKAM